MALLEGALTADGHHGVDELGVALHSDSFLIHVCEICFVGKINLLYQIVNKMNNLFSKTLMGFWGFGVLISQR